MASYDFVLWKNPEGLRVGFTVEGVDRGEADRKLAARMLAQGYTAADLLSWVVGSVVIRRPGR
jgi:hypothetical protein